MLGMLAHVSLDYMLKCLLYCYVCPNRLLRVDAVTVNHKIGVRGGGGHSADITILTLSSTKMSYHTKNRLILSKTVVSAPIINFWYLVPPSVLK